MTTDSRPDSIDVERLGEAFFRWSAFDPASQYADVKRRESYEAAAEIAGHYRALTDSRPDSIDAAELDREFEDWAAHPAEAEEGHAE